MPVNFPDFVHFSDAAVKNCMFSQNWRRTLLSHNIPFVICAMWNDLLLVFWDQPPLQLLPVIAAVVVCVCTRIATFENIARDSNCGSQINEHQKYHNWNAIPHFEIGRRRPTGGSVEWHAACISRQTNGKWLRMLYCWSWFPCCELGLMQRANEHVVTVTTNSGNRNACILLPVQAQLLHKQPA